MTKPTVIYSYTWNSTTQSQSYPMFSITDPMNEPIFLECGQDTYLSVYHDIMALITVTNIITSESQVFSDKGFKIPITEQGEYMLSLDDENDKYMTRYKVIERDLHHVSLHPPIQYVSHNGGMASLDVKISDTNKYHIMYRWYKNDALTYPSDPIISNGWTNISTGDYFTAGHYKVEVKQVYHDKDSCIKYAEATISEPCPLVIKLRPFKVSSDDRKVSIWATGGTLPYTYYLFKNNDLIKTTMMDDTFTCMGHGDYIIRVTDAKGLTQTVDFIMR
jgi:hypothetical protein